MASELENWSLEKWLKKLGLRKYKQAFVDNGYDTADLCATLHKEDLDAIGINNKTSRSTLFTQSRKLLELFQKEGLMASEEVPDEQIPKLSSKQSPKGSPKGADKKKNSKDKFPGKLALGGGSGHAPVNAVVGAQQQPLPDYSEPWNSNSAPVVPASGGSGSGVGGGGGGGGVGALPLLDYSEPWNSNAAGPPTSPTSKTPKTSLTTHSPAGSESTDAPARSPAHRQLSGATLPNSTARRKAPVSPGTDLPPFKKTGSSGLTRLQLKLKIREELFTRGVVLTEYPYCREVRKRMGACGLLS